MKRHLHPDAQVDFRRGAGSGVEGELALGCGGAAGRHRG